MSEPCDLDVLFFVMFCNVQGFSERLKTAFIYCSHAESKSHTVISKMCHSV